MVDWCLYNNSGPSYSLRVESSRLGVSVGYRVLFILYKSPKFGDT